MKRLFQKISISRILYVMSFLAVFFFCLESYVGYYFITDFLGGFVDAYRINNHLGKLHEVSGNTDDLAKSLSSLQSPDPDLESVRKIFAFHHDKSRRSLIELQNNFQTDKELAPFISQTQKLQDKMAEHARKSFTLLTSKEKQAETTQQSLRAHFLAVEQFRVEAIEALSGARILLNDRFNETFHVLYQSKDKPGTILVLFSGFASLVFIVLSYFVIKRIHESLANLENLVSKAGSGHLDVSAEVFYQDEIGKLTANFNEMIKKLNTSRIMLEETNRELERFNYVASHDLQEPLRRVVVYGDLLMEEQMNQLDENAVEYIRTMQRSAFRMRDLVQSLLNFSRLTNKDEKLVGMDLTTIIKDVLTDLEVAIQETHAQIEYANLPFVYGYPVKIRQLFQNLISNSIKFARPGIPVRVKIAGLGVKDGLAEISVTDNGVGFEEKYRDNIFLPFVRLQAKEKFPGTGIGLAICKRIVMQHGGTIAVKSTPGVGSVFFVKLPVKQDVMLLHLQRA